jgi:NitT/TauT family transport system substrate-binding protein
MLQASAGIALSMLLGACDQSSRPLIVARHVWPGYEFMYLAQELDLIDPQRVAFLETQSASETLQLLRDGKADGGALTLEEVLRARDRGLDLSVVLVFNISAGADVLTARSVVRTLKDLRGRRIGVADGAVGSVMLDRALAAADLSMRDVQVVPLTAGEQVAAWVEGRVDALVTYDLAARQIVASGGRPVFTSRQAPNLIVDVLAFRTDAPTAGDAISALIGAHFKAQQHFRTNHEDALFRLAPRLGLPADQIRATFRGLVLSDYQNNLRMLSGEQPVLLHGAQQLSAIMRTGGMIDQTAVLDTLIDDRHLLRSLR